MAVLVVFVFISVIAGSSCVSVSEVTLSDSRSKVPFLLPLEMGSVGSIIMVGRLVRIDFDGPDSRRYISVTFSPLDRAQIGSR